MAKKHYRAFKKQLEVNNSPKGTFIPNDKKNQLIIVAVLCLFVAFFKGLLVGYLVGNKKH
ncbi:MAG: hypothetical protein R3Y29_08465 [bacterium]